MFRLAPLLLLLSTAHAFITTNGDRTRWQRAPQPALTACSADLAAAPCRAAIAAAFNTWATVDGVDLPLPPLLEGRGDITVTFVAGRPELVGVLGVTTTTTDGDAIVGALVELNDDFTWALAGPRGTFDVQATATHEIGHALGLGHSPDRRATMYWHYDAGGGALGADDRRGLRFLYGDRAGQGLACDSCDLPGDCAEGVCLQRQVENGTAYCAPRCAGGCAADEICVALAGGGDACIPAQGSCGFASGRPAGAPCWGPFQCVRGLRCVVYPADARCAAECDGPAQCDDGTVCMLDPVDLPRACLPPGDADLGAPCAWATDCASGVCAPDGRCSAWCDDDCPAGWVCEAAPHWPDQPRICVPMRDAPDAGPADASLPDATIDAEPPDAGETAIDAAPGDAAVPVDARTEDASLVDATLDMRVPPVIVPPTADTDGGCSQGSDQSVEALVCLIIMLVCFLIMRRRARRD